MGNIGVVSKKKYLIKKAEIERLNGLIKTYIENIHTLNDKINNLNNKVKDLNNANAIKKMK